LFRIGDTQQYTFYLLHGAIRMTDAKGSRVIIESGTERGRYALSNLLPRQFHARIASAEAIVLRIDKELLDKEIVWGQLAQADTTDNELQDNEWKIELLRTPVFARLPMSSVQTLFDELEEVFCKAGKTVIKEGQAGDYYYIIRSGSCKVARHVDGREVVLSTLQAPSGFGDEALVSNKPRNATVIMTTDGLLMRLSKTNFQSLMHAPLTKRVELDVAQRAVRKHKAILIDVRMEEEFTRKQLPNAVNIPLFLLYIKTKTMKKGLKYILYCDTGARSEAGAFILTRSGFESYVLNNPARALSSKGQNA